jgi:hypothetical protein
LHGGAPFLALSRQPSAFSRWTFISYRQGREGRNGEKMNHSLYISLAFFASFAVHALLLSAQ